MKSKNFKKTLALMLVSTLCIPLFSTTKAFAWNDKTHQHIVREGYNSLKSSYPKVSIDMNGLLAGAIAPDYEGIDNGSPDGALQPIAIILNGGWKSHFYDYKTGTNFLKESDPTAKTKFIHYATSAVKYWKNDKATATKFLGKACHYLGDLNVPHHVSNQPAIVSSHQAFEKLIEQNINSSGFKIGNSSSYYVTVPKNDANFKAYLEALVSNNAKKAYELKGDATAFYNGKEAVGDIPMKAGIQCVTNASHYTAAFLRAFFTQVDGI